jgi:hypothetical protein
VAFALVVLGALQTPSHGIHVADADQWGNI